MSEKRQNRIKRSVCFWMVFLTAFQLTGCAEKTKEQPEVTEAPVRQEILWRGESFAEIMELTDGTPVYLVEYQEGIENLPYLSGEDYNSVNFEYLGCYQDKLYLLTTRSNTEWIEREDGSLILNYLDAKYYVSTYDLNTKEKECREITFDFPHMGGAVTGSGELLFFTEVLGEETVEHYYAVYMDLSGTVRTMVDLYPAMQEFGLKLETNVLVNCVDYDSRGYLYVMDSKDARVGVIDETGVLAGTMELSLERVEQFSCTTRTRDGIAIFEATGIKGTNKVTTLFWYDDEKSDISILVDIGSGGGTTSPRYMGQYEEIYYFSTGGNLVRWNWRTGVREKIFSCSENGINTNFYNKYCITNEDGQLFLLDLNEDTAQLYGLSETEPDYESIVSIADIRNIQKDEFIQSCAAVFSRKNPLYHVEYELTDRDRILNEILAGKGPELLVVSREDMEVLYEKGALADLSDVLSEETREQIFNCVLEAGQIDGKLIGLADSASGYTLYVSRDVWQKDTWSVEEFVDLVESMEGALENIIVGQNPMWQNKSMIFSNIVLRDLNNSPFIDWERGKCYFDSQLFRRVLELCMHYGNQEEINYTTSDDLSANQLVAIQKMKDGRALAYFGWGIGDFALYSVELSRLGGDFYSVGFPTGERSGSFCSIDSFLVVNAQAENLDAIYDFLRYCYDRDNQRTSTATVRKDVMREFVEYSSRNDQWIYNRGDGSYTIVESKPDGTSWLEEYLECMDNCVPLPVRSGDVLKIINEEIDYYFDGARNLDQTIDVLQRRVQLYLDEHQQ